MVQPVLKRSPMTRVTRWRYYLNNFRPFPTLKISPIAIFLAKIGSICFPILNSPSQNCPKDVNNQPNWQNQYDQIVRFSFPYLTIYNNESFPITCQTCPVLVVTGGDSRSSGREFKCQPQTLNGHFSHLFVVKIVLFVR